MPIGVALILALIVTVICTILTLVLIIPEKRRAELPKFFQFCHDLFNVKWLLIEKILKVFYVFLTFFVIAYGFFLLFTREGYYWGGYRSFAGWGLLYIFVGPIVIRLLHEALMLTILLVTNVISINNILLNSGQKKDILSLDFQNYKTSKPVDSASVPAAPTVSVKTCPGCGIQLNGGVEFCPQCGQRQN